MLYINTLKISEDRNFINVDVETGVGDTINSISVLTDKTYGTTETIDLSSKLSNINNREILNVSLLELGIDAFEGIYIFEFTTTDVESECSTCPSGNLIGVTADFTKYHECIVNSILREKDINKAKKLNTLLESIFSSLRLNWIEEAIYLMGYLDEYCTTDCVSCKDSNKTFETSLGFGTINNNVIV